MHKNEDDILALYRRFLSNQCTENEIDQLLTYFAQQSKEDLLLLTQDEFFCAAKEVAPSIAETMKLIQLQGNIRRSMEGQIQPEPPEPSYFKRFPILVAAAIILLLVGGGCFIWYHSGDRNVHKIATQHLSKEINAGHFGAVLHLSDGRTIVLDSAANGTLANQGNVQVIKDKNGIRYTGSNKAVVYNTIETGPGREFHFILPDGSAVWLNAASSIAYPIAFKGNNRSVRVTGEAYFQVAHNEKMPFIVHAGELQIEDVGTAFNVKAYPDEAAIRTTLVEGAARVITAKQSALLKPGEQASVDGHLKVIPDADIETVLGWRNGSFQFHNTELREVMRQVGRWYNVSIEYKGYVPSTLFTGRIPRNMPASKVLTILEELGVQFSIKRIPEKGARGIVTVTP